MECGAEYSFTSPEQFFNELQDIISISPNDSSLDELDYALRNYVAFASRYMDQFLPTPDSLDFALQSLLTSPLFTSHPTRMTAQIISLLKPTTPASHLFITLMLILELGLTNPLSVPSSSGRQSYSTKVTENHNTQVFKAVRNQWNEVVKVLITCVERADILEGGGGGLGMEGTVLESKIFMPDAGWEERLGTAATAVLYQVCRVQRLSRSELVVFSYEFIQHLFKLVEKTRDAEDETFNYTLIALIIALNEQYMVSSLPPSSHGSKISAPHGHGILVDPILPTTRHHGKSSSSNGDGKGQRKREEVEGAERETNLVLRVLRNCEGDSKTFGENMIFILNRANGSNDSLCTSLLILKILYLLFTTAGTQEYFYTNDLCVLVDVFIRELCDLDEDSEGLKHTYLRVLHPLLTHTQLRNHPYKRRQLYRVLTALISNSSYKEVDPTTRRLVERNLKGSWCEGFKEGQFGEDEGSRRGSVNERKGSDGENESVRGWSSGMGGRRGNSLNATTTPTTPTTISTMAEEEVDLGDKIKALRLDGHPLVGITREGSTDSVDLVAETKDYGTGKKRRDSLNESESILIDDTTTATNGSYLANNLDYYSSLPRSSSPLSFPPTSSSSSSDGRTTARSNSNPSLPLLLPVISNSSSSPSFLLLPPLAEVNRRRSSSLLSPMSSSTTEAEIERPSSTTGSSNKQRRRAPPPPPSPTPATGGGGDYSYSNPPSRSSTPSIKSFESSESSKALPNLPVQRRAAPGPPIRNGRS